jgi:Dickkopf N-terminal cysteine-rich region
MGRSALIFLVVAIGCSSGVPGLAGRPDGGTVCQNNESICTGDTRCTNGVCQKTCTGGTSCGAGSYCEGPSAPLDVCAPLQPLACVSDLDCPLPQSCNYGLCASVETAVDGGQACNFRSASDGCKPDAVCSAGGQFGFICVAYSACAADGGCVAQNDQAEYLCNQQPDGGFLIPGKQRICLSGHCLQPSNCGSGQKCYVASGALVGDCQYGIEGDPCSTTDDCESGRGCASNGFCVTCTPTGQQVPDGGAACPP